MRANIHGSRKGTNGKAISAKHNDRNFDYLDDDHIDPFAVDNNVYWKYQDVQPVGEKTAAEMTFDEYELAWYEQNVSEYLEARNQKAIDGRQPSRVQTMEQFRKNMKACPEENVFTIGNKREQIPPELLREIYEEYTAWHIETFPNIKILDAAMHLDEANPHIQSRKVWTAHDEEGRLIISQKQALEEMGIERPNPNKPVGKFNNAKMTYTAMCREKQLELAKKHGLEIIEEPQEPSKSGLSMLEYQTMQEQRERDAAIRARKEAEKRADAADERAAAAEERAADANQRADAAEERAAVAEEKATAMQRERDEARGQVEELLRRADELTLDDKKGAFESKAHFEERQAMFTREKQLDEREGRLNARQQSLDAREQIVQRREDVAAADRRDIDKTVQARAMQIVSTREQQLQRQLDKLNDTPLDRLNGITVREEVKRQSDEHKRSKQLNRKQSLGR